MTSYKYTYFVSGFFKELIRKTMKSAKYGRNMWVCSPKKKTNTVTYCFINSLNSALIYVFCNVCTFKKQTQTTHKYRTLKGI